MGWPPAARAKPGQAEHPEKARHALLGAAAVRTIAALVALPLVPVLYTHDFLVAGIAGAVVAVPIVAVITRAVPELRRREPADLGAQDA